jgi:hypothetical protein
MSSGIFIAALGLAVIAVGLFGILRKLAPIQPRRPEDGISLIELGISKVDPNFVPAGEQPWERKFDKLICWLGVFIGIAMVGIGLTYAQD